LRQSAIVILVAVADENKLEVAGFDADGIHHINQLLTLPEAPGVHQERLVRQDNIVPGGSQVLISAVEVLGGQAYNLKTGRKPEAHRHPVAVFIARPKYFPIL
jgi:hypothetical protein